MARTRTSRRNYHDLNQGKAVIAETSTGGWNALTTKYWMAATIPEQAEQVTMIGGCRKAEWRDDVHAGYRLTPYVDRSPASRHARPSRIFAGAKRVNGAGSLREQDGIPAFTDAVDWSWLFFITKPFFWLLKTFQSWFGSFGLAILALTVVREDRVLPAAVRHVQIDVEDADAAARDEIASRSASPPIRSACVRSRPSCSSARRSTRWPAACR